MSAKITLKKKEGIKVAEKENTEEVENIEVKEKQEKVLHSNEEYDELNDRYKRVLAEFENFKKRSQKERESLYNSVLGDIITGMLPAIDNLENAVKAESKDEKIEDTEYLKNESGKYERAPVVDTSKLNTLDEKEMQNAGKEDKN